MWTFLKTLMLWLVILSSSTAQFVSVQLRGEVQVLTSHQINYENLWLDNNNGSNTVPIEVPGIATLGALTGDRIVVDAQIPLTGRRLLSTTTQIRALSIETISQGAAKDFIVDGRPVTLNTATVITDFCGKTVPVTVNNVRESWFGSSNNTLQKFFSTCTYNLLNISPQNSVVIRVSLPCTGTRPDNQGIQYNFTGSWCRNPQELDTWRYFATEEIRRQFPSQRFQRLIILIPDTPACPWAGLASSGCPRDVLCTSWIHVRNPILNIATVFHELLHNTGLYHSNRISQQGRMIEYGDHTDPMGRGSQPIICPNAPQSWKAGWCQPVTTIDARTQLSRTTTLTLPVHGSLSRSITRIILTERTSMFITLRRRNNQTLFDSGLPGNLNDRIYIHLFNGSTNAPRPDPWQTPPVLVAILDMTSSSLFNPDPMLVQQQYVYDNSIVVSFINKQQVTVCKKRVDIENDIDSCTNNVDDDCNGFVDERDPSCFQVLDMPSAPPGNPPPSPPIKKSPPPKRFPPPPPIKKSPPPKRFPPPPPIKKQSPSPPPPLQPSIEIPMTERFPLGSCKGSEPSVPYILINPTVNPGSICFRIKLLEDYIPQCIARNMRTPCEFMRHNFRKIVFSYRLVPECGYDMTSNRTLGSIFPWAVIDANDKLQYVAKYKFFARNATRSHAAGDVTLFKWGFPMRNGDTFESVEINVSRTNLVQRNPDTDVDGYRICLDYDPSLVDVPSCMSDSNGVIKYSFYDPNKLICTVGEITLP